MILTGECHASGVLASLSVMNNDMDQCGLGGTVGHQNFQNPDKNNCCYGKETAMEQKSGSTVN